jgi:hypothetical protein
MPQMTDYTKINRYSSDFPHYDTKKKIFPKNQQEAKAPLRFILEWLV